MSIILYCARSTPLPILPAIPQMPTRTNTCVAGFRSYAQVSSQYNEFETQLRLVPTSHREKSRVDEPRQVRIGVVKGPLRILLLADAMFRILFRQET